MLVVCGVRAGNPECTVLGGSARLKSMVSPTTAKEGMILERRQRRSSTNS
jgi:hypothetical protein